MNNKCSRQPADPAIPLPDGWRWVRLGEASEINPRRSDIIRQDMEPTSFVPMEAVDAEMGVISEIRERPFADVKKGYTYFENGDVLFAKITPCMQNGKHAIARSLLEGIGFASTEFHVIRPAKVILADWIHYFVRQPTVLHDATNHFTGAVGQQRVPDDFLKSLEIPLPPIEEQRRIAGVLREQMAAVGKARTAAQARLEAVKALPAAFLRQVFPQPGHPLPGGWRWVKLGEVSSTISKGTTPTTLGLQYTDAGIPFLRAEDVSGWAIKVDKVAFHISNDADETLSRSRLLPGDFLITIAGTLGRVGYVPPEVPHLNCNQAVAFARLDQSMVDTQYLCFVCRLEHVIAPLLDQKAGGALQNLKLQQIRYLDIPLPPLPEQRRIAAVLREQMATVEKARAAAQEELATINALPAALLRRAFNGEL